MKNPKWVIGIDEVGRGPLAGPVTVCAVVLPYKKYHVSGWAGKKDMWRGLTDSKKMTAISREQWYLETESLSREFGMRYAIASRTAKQIDTKGIAVCIRECIKSILEELSLDPKECLVLLDGGLKAPIEYVYQETIIRGDASQPVISLASVVAKVTRDKYMTQQHKKFPQYNFEKNKGYGTLFHRMQIKKYGTITLHRLTFLTRILGTV